MTDSNALELEQELGPTSCFPFGASVLVGTDPTTLTFLRSIDSMPSATVSRGVPSSGAWNRHGKASKLLSPGMALFPLLAGIVVSGAAAPLSAAVSADFLLIWSDTGPWWPRPLRLAEREQTLQPAVSLPSRGLCLRVHEASKYRCT